MKTDYKYLGWENGWIELPDEVKKCNELGHITNTTSENCVHTVICDTCKITYKYDSGE